MGFKACFESYWWHGILPGPRTGWKPVPPKAAGEDARPYLNFQDLRQSQLPKSDCPEPRT
jgi:hypothetical protein